ncbi:glycosyltransferase family 4 protein [Bartonella tamiae]|uniref:glycosyltransferase family 4 protein n=1 Tax=Bartonella tamiae TaxID=373638 RepID=UPI00026E54C8|nr:glycosyltransferase family 4 protein [Bartonella tamiae]EJF94734.1 hypothetical protein MEG_00315 [Bartonella tamiae Th307]
MSKRKIAIIAHLKYPISEPFAGGLEMHTHMLASKLQKKGHDVTLFAAANSATDIKTYPICDATELSNIGTQEAHNEVFFKEHHAYMKLMCTLKRNQFDIVHNNSLHYLPIAMADILPMPVVTTLHTPPFCWLESGFRCASGQNNTVVAISNTTAKMWENILRVDSVIPNGIDLDKFAFSPHWDQSLLNKQQETYVIWYGRIVREKGLHHAIDAARLAQVHLKIAGPIWDEYYYTKEIKPRLGSETEYLGHVSHEKLAQLIAGARASICTPCWEEPFGLVVVESLSVGVAVAAFARGAMSELLDEKSGALASPNDARSLAQAIKKAMNCNRADCRQRAEEIANADKMISHYERLYEHLIEKKKAKLLSNSINKSQKTRLDQFIQPAHLRVKV